MLWNRNPRPRAVIWTPAESSQGSFWCAVKPKLTKIGQCLCTILLYSAIRVVFSA